MAELAKQADQILAENMVSLPLDPLPNILIWNDTVLGRRQRQPGPRSVPQPQRAGRTAVGPSNIGTMARVKGPGPGVAGPLARLGDTDGMFIYVLRRALYSIPVLLLASFLVFCMVSATFDPTAKRRAVARTRPQCAPRCARSSASTGRSSRSTATGCRRASQGDFGDSCSSRQAVSRRRQARVLEHDAAHHLGHRDLGDRRVVRRRLHRGAAVLRIGLHVHRPRVRRASPCPRSGSA